MNRAEFAKEVRKRIADTDDLLVRERLEEFCRGIFLFVRSPTEQIPEHEIEAARTQMGKMTRSDAQAILAERRR